MNKFSVKHIIVFSLFLFLIIPINNGYCQAKVKWSMFTTMPAPLSPPKAYKKVLDAVREKTNGAFDIQLYTAGQLPYKMEDELSVVSKRRVEMAEVNNQHSAGYRDWMGLTGQAVVFKDTNEALDMWSGPLMDWMNKQFAKTENCIAIAPIILSNQSIWTKKKFGSLSDIKGMTIRVPDSVAEELMNSLGAHSVYMQFSEMNEAVMRGTIDGVLTGTVMAQENPSWTNIYDFLLPLEVNYSLSYICVNLDAWKELPADFQNILRTEAMKGMKALNQRFFDNIQIVHSYENNPQPDLTVLNVSAQDRQLVKDNGKNIFDKWIKAKNRSDEAKSLWAYIQSLRK